MFRPGSHTPKKDGLALSDGNSRLRAKVSGNFDRLDHVFGGRQSNWLRVETTLHFGHLLL